MKLLLILGLVINLAGYGEIPEEGMRIEMTEAHEDIMTGEMVMELTGSLLCDTELTVNITRSEAGIKDEFCCAGQCKSGNSETTEQLTFTPNGMAEWFSHYNPAPNSDVTVSYTFSDGTESRTLTVQYLYGVTPTPALFPRKHLIEEFTGQACGYCPYGMDCISEFMKNDTNFILILHHYGYQADNFSVSGSQTITNSLGVNGAPSVAIDRKKTKTSETNTIVFHPAYLPTETDKNQFETETYASVNIANTFDPKKRKLTVMVSGEIRKEDYPALNLTVLVKESGMIDTQADYYGSFEGWKEFRHCNAVRAFLTGAKGDAITVDSTLHYSVTYTTTLDQTWVPENCMVVAFLGESFKPVIQVEDEPVVAGTAGGDDIEHGGITPVPVSSYYPEPGATKGPSNYSGVETEELEVANAYRSSYPNEGYNLWSIQAYSKTRTITVSGVKCVPFLWMYFFTAIDERTLPNGTFTFDTSMQPGTAYAGFRDDEHQVIDGSIFYFTNKSYFNQGYLSPAAEWLITTGTFVMSDTGWSVQGTARNGSAIKILGTTPIEYDGKPQDIDLVNTEGTQKAVKFIEDGKLVIRTADGQVFTTTGKRVQ